MSSNFNRLYIKNKQLVKELYNINKINIMDHQRKERSDKYHQKKQLHDKYDKVQKHKFNEQETNLLQNIQNMSANELYNFMQKKFDKVIGNNEKILPKIYSGIRKRFGKLIQEFKRQQKENLVKFVRKHTGVTLGQEDIKQIFQPKSGVAFKLSSNQLIHISYQWSKQQDPRIRMIKITILQPKQQFSNIKQKFYFYGIDEDMLNGLQVKRFRKDCSEYLEDYIQTMKKVTIALQQQ